MPCFSWYGSGGEGTGGLDDSLERRFVDEKCKKTTYFVKMAFICKAISLKENNKKGCTLYGIPTINEIN